MPQHAAAPSPDGDGDAHATAASVYEPTMKAGGFYNANSSMQERAAQRSMALLEQAARAVPMPGGATPFGIADVGCSQGRNSVAPLRAVLRVLQERAAEASKDPGEQAAAGAVPGAGDASISGSRSSCGPLQVMVHHEDLPSNDFGSVFAIIEDPAATYVPTRQQAPDLRVFSSVVGRSFYDRWAGGGGARPCA